jgi:hypothetical protein
MTDLPQHDADMLRTIAQPEVAGVPGALGEADIGVLLSSGYVTFGFTPAVDGAPFSYTYANAWVSPTDAGWAWLRANPA